MDPHFLWACCKIYMLFPVIHFAPTNFQFSTSFLFVIKSTLFRLLFFCITKTSIIVYSKFFQQFSGEFSLIQLSQNGSDTKLTCISLDVLLYSVLESTGNVETCAGSWNRRKSVHWKGKARDVNILHFSCEFRLLSIIQ